MEENHLLTLIKPGKEYLESFLTLCRESFHSVHNTYLLRDPERFEEWKNSLFIRYEKDEQGIELPENFLPSVTFWVLYGEEVAGVVNIRKGLNDALKDYGGNAGFMLSSRFRGKKLSHILIPLVIAKTKEVGAGGEVLMTCTDNNIPSLSALKKIPAKKVERAITWADGKYCPVHRFYF